MKRDALPLPDPALPAGTIRLSDLPPEQYTALRSAIEAAARRERARVAEQLLKMAADGIRRLFRRRDQRSIAVGLTRPCAD